MLTPERPYLAVDHELRSLLFGNGLSTSAGFVKGEDARLQVAALLNEMQVWSERMYAALDAHREAGDALAAESDDVDLIRAWRKLRAETRDG